MRERLAVSSARDDEPAEAECDEREDGEEQRFGADLCVRRRERYDRHQHGGLLSAASSTRCLRSISGRCYDEGRRGCVIDPRLTARALIHAVCRAMTCVIVSRVVWRQHRDVVEAMLQRGGYTLVVIEFPDTSNEVDLYCSTHAVRCPGCSREEIVFTGRAAPARPDSPPVERVIRYPLHCPLCVADPTGRR